MSLLRAEARRMGKRRLVRWLLLGFLAVLAAVVATTAWQSERPTPQVQVRAAAEAQQAYREAARSFQEYTAPCQAAVRQGQQPPPGFGPDCAGDSAPRAEDFRAEDHLPYLLRFRAAVHPLMAVFAALFTLVGLLVGATFVGAEWSTGAMANLLLWRPQRSRVLLTKYLTAALTVLLVGAVTAGLWVGSLYLAAALRGDASGVTAGLLQSVGLDAARGVGLALCAATFGFAVAALGRHTAAALGAALAVWLVGLFGPVVAAMVTTDPWTNWLSIVTYAQAVLDKLVEVPPATCDSAVSCSVPVLTVHWYHAFALFGGGGLLLLLAAFVSHRRRPVT